MRAPMTNWSVKVYGDATRPALVLLHAIATDARLWSPQLPIWSQHFFLIVPDLPGHGKSAAEDAVTTMTDYADGVAQVLDQLKIETAALAGISLGGMIAQTFALRHPQRVKALVLAQTMAQVAPTAITTWQGRKQLAQQQGMQSIVASTLQRWFTPAFLQSAPLTTQWIGELIQATSVAGYVNAIGAIQAFDVLTRLHEITAPTLVVAGAADQAATPDMAQTLVSRLSNARLLVLDDAAHLANVEQAVAFTENIGAFLHEVLQQSATQRVALPTRREA